jgi:hypothetical protein
MRVVVVVVMTRWTMNSLPEEEDQGSEKEDEDV